MEGEPGEKMNEQEEFEFRLRLEQESAKPPSEKKPLVRGLLPDSLGQFFPSEKESQTMRQERGLSLTPKEPVPEYSAGEEALLGGLVASPALGAVKAGVGAVKGAVGPMARRAAGMGLSLAKKKLPWVAAGAEAYRRLTRD